MGIRPGGSGGFKVIYSPSPLSANPLLTHPKELDDVAVFKGFSLLPKIEITAPGWNNSTIEGLELSNSESDAYADLFHPDGITHRIGGYPDEIQGSLDLEAELVSHGIYCGGPKGYEEGRRRGLGSGVSEWRLLLQVDSQEDAGVMWGDLGRIYFQIREQDLRNLDLDRVHVALQCG